MDRRSKIIVSVVGIFIVLLALIGITYAYFLTRVEGNTNDTSISITTANLRIVYDDNDSQINATNIQPGDTVYTKTFKVTNEGNETVEYAVYLENIINEFVHYNDLRMYITCVNQDNEACNGYGIDTDNDGDIDLEDANIYPRVNSKLIENTIEPAPDADSDGEVHTYTLYLQFRDNGDQSDDMGKVLQGRVQIYDPNSVVAITGNVEVPEGDNTKYYVELHSDVKTSQISSDGTYLFEGVEPQNEAHTLYIKYIDSDGAVQTVGSQQIKVSKGDTASISITNDNNSSMIINEFVIRANIDIEVTASDISISGNMLGGFEEGTLASKILSDNTLKNGENLDFDIVENGLYYTGKNTEDNGVTYFYRGNVDNNFLTINKKTGNQIWVSGDYCSIPNGMSIYISPEDKNDTDIIYNKDKCLNSTICEYETGESYTDYCDNIFGFIGDDGNEIWFYPTIHEPGTITEWVEPVYETEYEELSVWRIVRINEDGSVRLIYHGDGTSLNSSEPSSIGQYYYTTEDVYYGLGSSIIEGLKDELNVWYESNLADFSSNIVDTGFCNDLTYTLTTAESDDLGMHSSYGYGPYNRIKQKSPQFACPNSNYLLTTSSSEKGNNTLDNPIGLLTADESMYAGTTYKSNSLITYLSKYNSGTTLSPGLHAETELGGPLVTIDLGITSEGSGLGNLYPVINIKGDLSVEGNGTTESPYKIVVE